MLKISTPKSWQELTPPQLRYILTLQAQGIPSGTIQVSAFLHFAGLKIYKTEGDSLRLRAGMKVYRVKASDIAMAAMALDFITDPPTYPQLLPELGGKQAKDAELHGVPFAHYLQIENYMQQYLRTKDATLLTPVLALLYEGNLQENDIDDTARYMVLHWYNGLKPFLAATFSDLFRPVAGAEGEEPDLQEIMLAQIRALTGGDVTKEEQVLNVDTWTALAELNAKAREAKEVNKMYNKNH